MDRGRSRSSGRRVEPSPDAWCAPWPPARAGGMRAFGWSSMHAPWSASRRGAVHPAAESGSIAISEQLIRPSGAGVVVLSCSEIPPLEIQQQERSVTTCKNQALHAAAGWIRRAQWPPAEPFPPC